MIELAFFNVSRHFVQRQYHIRLFFYLLKIVYQTINIRSLPCSTTLRYFYRFWIAAVLYPFPPSGPGHRDKSRSSRFRITNYLPYDLTYQLTTYSRHPRHDRAIIFQMQEKFPSQYGTLQVPNDLGTETAQRHMFLDGFLKRDMIEEGRRLFRNAYTVRVVSEMTPSTANNALSTVQTVEINRITTNIPTGLTPVSHLP